MSQHLQNAYLASDSLNIAGLYYFLFLKSFDRNLLVCWYVHCEPHFAESALADRLALVMTLFTYFVVPQHEFLEIHIAHITNFIL